MGNTEKFDSIANSYDTPERVHIAKVSADAIRIRLGNARNKNAIDFGCGTGLVGMALREEFGTIRFVDTSQKMLDIVEQKIIKEKVGNADTLRFDFETSAGSALRTDYIFMVQVLLHIKDIEPVLSRLHEILNDEGHLLIVDFNRNENVVSDMVHSGFDQEALIEVLSGIGYRDISVGTFYEGSRLFMGQDASLFILDAKK